MRSHAEPGVRALILATFLLLAIFVVLPLVRVLGASVLVDGALTTQVWRDMLTVRGALQPLRNSLLLAATVAITGTLTGFVAAYALAMTTLPARRTFRFLAMLPMLAPPFMIALAAIMLLGRNGMITRTVIEPLAGTGFDIYGFAGLVLVQTLTFFPLSMLLLVAALGALDPALGEAAQSQGATPWRVFRDVVLPLAMPGVLSSMLLLFIESLADFGNPLILGGDFRVLSVAAFLRITGEFDTAGGAVLATLLLLPAVSAYFRQRRLSARSTFATLTGRPSAQRHTPAPRMLRAFVAAGCSVIAAAIVAFYGTVLYGSVVEVWGVAGDLTLDNYGSALAQARAALTDSLLLAGIATPIAGAIGMAIAWLLVRRTFAGRSLLATLALLTFAVPGTVLGIGYVLAFNRAPLPLSGTAAIIVLLFVFRSVPVAIEAGRNAIAQVDPSIEESSASLGAAPFMTWRRIVLPLAAPALFAGLAHAFVRSITAISAVIFVVSGQWSLVTVSILGFVENADLARASALCVIVVGLVSIVLGLMQLAVSRYAVRA